MPLLLQWLSRSRNDRLGDIDLSPVQVSEADPDTATSNTPDAREQEAPNILNIPLEIRYKVFSHLLRNDPLMFEEWSERVDPFDIPSILLVNRQLYQEAFSYIYRTNTVMVHIGPDGLWFLRARQFFIELYLEAWERCEGLAALQEEACNIRGYLRKLCGEFSKQKIRFRKLRIVSPSPQSSPFGGLGGRRYPSGRIDHWDKLWDSEGPNNTANDFLFEERFMLPEDNMETEQSELMTYPKYPSTFLWVLSTLALCQALADECVIELPESLKEKDRMRRVADWYEKLVEGIPTHGLENFLESDQWALNHTVLYSMSNHSELRMIWKVAVCQSRTNLQIESLCGNTT
ncbi:MAG: hypothetical protein Q9169_008056 [Polycauliona sp. 2 TL-2023]